MVQSRCVVTLTEGPEETMEKTEVMKNDQNDRKEGITFFFFSN